MQSKVVVCRKSHECYFCGEMIEKGEKACVSSGRSPVYADDMDQIGIEYWRSYQHHDTGCMELMTIQFRGMTFECRPRTWTGIAAENFGQAAVLGVLGTEKPDGRDFVYGETIEECFKNLIAGEIIDPEWERVRCDV